MYSLMDLIMTGITLFIIGLSLGAILIVSADNDGEDVTEIIYSAGYEKGKADEQKRIMCKLEEDKKGNTEV